MKRKTDRARLKESCFAICDAELPLRPSTLRVLAMKRKEISLQLDVTAEVNCYECCRCGRVEDWTPLDLHWTGMEWECHGSSAPGSGWLTIHVSENWGDNDLNICPDCAGAALESLKDSV